MDFRVGGPCGVRECPKCRFTMIRLRESNLINRNEGYLLDYGDQRWFLWALLYGFVDTLIDMFLFYVLTPLGAKALGGLSQKHYRRTLRRYPKCMVCPHCKYLIREP
jgi:hypothetical protein